MHCLQTTCRSATEVPCACGACERGSSKPGHSPQTREQPTSMGGSQIERSRHPGGAPDQRPRPARGSSTAPTASRLRRPLSWHGRMRACAARSAIHAVLTAALLASTSSGPRAGTVSTAQQLWCYMTATAGPAARRPPLHPHDAHAGGRHAQHTSHSRTTGSRGARMRVINRKDQPDVQGRCRRETSAHQACPPRSRPACELPCSFADPFFSSMFASMSKVQSAVRRRASTVGLTLSNPERFTAASTVCSVYSALQVQGTKHVLYCL